MDSNDASKKESRIRVEAPPETLADTPREKAETISWRYCALLISSLVFSFASLSLVVITHLDIIPSLFRIQ